MRLLFAALVALTSSFSTMAAPPLLADRDPLTSLINRRALPEIFRDVQDSFSRVTATLVESVTGIRVTQGFARQSYNAGLFHELVSNHAAYNVNTARSLGVTIRREPGMCAAGWFIPILNLWWPPQVIRSFVPDRDQLRVVLEWWACWIITSLSLAGASCFWYCMRPKIEWLPDSV